MAGKLKEALEKLDAAVKDLTSLHVQTYTGTMNFKGFDDKPFDTVRGAIETAATTPDSKITLVAESLYKFDGDSYNFLADGDMLSPAVLELHKASVESGIKTRQGLMQMVKGFFD